MTWKEKNMINLRTEFALKAMQEGVNFSQLCQEYGISRRVGYKWKARFKIEGCAGMMDQSRKPKTHPGEVSEDVLLKIVRLHEAHKHWGPKKIRELYARTGQLAPSESTFKRIFEKAGWVQKRKRRVVEQSGRLHQGVRAEGPNDIWTIDFKGWWYTQDGERFEPLTVRDEKSRYVLEARSMGSSSTQAVREVLERLFTKHGLPRVIRSDNGSPFAAHNSVLGLSRLSAWLVALGIDLERGRPGNPQDNGAHERMHRDIQEELQAFACTDVVSQQAAMDIWRNTFNQERPHESLGMKTPAEAYQNSTRKYEGTPSDLSYPTMLARRVSSSGKIRINNRPIGISTALAGWSVGLKYSDLSIYQVFFSNLRIGQIDIEAELFLRAAGGPEEELAQNKNVS
jgi:putative transposase